MQKYREEKDRLEYEKMMSDPSTAYLVDDAEFDRQIDELGVTEVGTAAGMYIERGAEVDESQVHPRVISRPCGGYPQDNSRCRNLDRSLHRIP